MLLATTPPSAPLLMPWNPSCCAPSRSCTRACGRRCLWRSARCCTPSIFSSTPTCRTRCAAAALGLLMLLRLCVEELLLLCPGLPAQHRPPAQRALLPGDWMGRGCRIVECSTSQHRLPHRVKQTRSWSNQTLHQKKQTETSPPPPAAVHGDVDQRAAEEPSRAHPAHRPKAGAPPGAAAGQLCQ